MDAAVARMPECPECGKRVDENALELPYCVIDGVHYHEKCLGFSSEANSYGVRCLACGKYETACSCVVES